MVQNLVNPICSLLGRNPAEDNDDIEGRGRSKKRMICCNGMHKGSKFALIQKDADLLHGIKT
jgi:hypothetical protein